MPRDSDDARLAHEQQFWDHHVLPLDYCLAEYHRGPDPNTAVLIEALEPLAGRRVLDFACGAGVLTAWLTARGADVTGVDLSEGAVERAKELLNHLSLQATLLVEDDLGNLGQGAGPRFDRIAGRFALHHVDPGAVAPALGACLAEDGRSAFLETMATNPALRLARNHLVGHFGIPRLGTLDESPLTMADVKLLGASLGTSSIRLGQMACMRILDRQVLHYRFPRASRALTAIDSLLIRWKLLTFLSYHQVLVFDRHG